ncbi:hypothetical protein PoB_005936700 [Plakobranchus ocellatus]|uniref:OTU domain-containing protein n=1 Tax=Plakobranchus ocellatus TaxID=259542 RepID=A0AAV4CLS1_9GAST|nr:hypothetical protein PoB_005936700 [Plakobranchus ocellatus]
MFVKLSFSASLVRSDRAWPRQCVPLTEEQFGDLSSEDLNFVCARCAFTANGIYDDHAVLKRMYDADPSHRQAAARSERVLINIYGVEYPPINGKGSTLKYAKSDDTAEQILKIFHPAKLQGYKPLKVQADGNCFYRAVSLGCFGTERFHTLLRMLSGIEVLLHPTYSL